LTKQPFSPTPYKIYKLSKKTKQQVKNKKGPQIEIELYKDIKLIKELDE
jgi:hypothetical protein